MSENLKNWTPLIVSLVVAYMGWHAPNYRMPIDYDAIIWRSIPFAIAWVIVLAFCLWRCKKPGLWALLGMPMALYWPIWLLFNHLPSCYYLHNCE